MNYFAHALPFLERPYFLAGVSVPDWLAATERSLRLRAEHVEEFLQDADHCTAEVAAGILQHFHDDARFHSTRAFAETSWLLTAQVREALNGETGLRPVLVGHLLVELLLDAALISDAPERLTLYYKTLDEMDAVQVAYLINRMTPRPTRKLADFIKLFRRERVLWDYLVDAKLLKRLGQLMNRVGFEPVPDSLAALLPEARKMVRRQKDGLFPLHLVKYHRCQPLTRKGFYAIRNELATVD